MQRIRGVPVDPARLQSVFRAFVFLRNVRRITGRFPATPRTIVRVVRGKFVEKKRREKPRLPAFVAGRDGWNAADGCSRNPGLFLRVHRHAALDARARGKGVNSLMDICNARARECARRISFDLSDF